MTRVLLLLQASPHRIFTTREIYSKLPTIGRSNIRNVLRACLKNGTLVHIGSHKSGKYTATRPQSNHQPTSSPSPQSNHQPTIEDIRVAVTQHINATPQRIYDAGPAPSPFREGATPIPAAEHPAIASAVGREFAADIVERMKGEPKLFSTYAVAFIERIVRDRFPLTEQQQLVLAQGRPQDLKTRTP